jgi:glycosyltransferase involved in cell wall biosynthesis
MKLLWLASWFPSRVDPTAGDFIERQAEAVAPALTQLNVFHVVRDDQLKPGKIEWTKEERPHYTVWIAYYCPPSLPRVLETTVAGLLYMRSFQVLWKQCYGEQDRPDLMHVHVAMRAGLVARYWSKRYRISYIVTEHWTGYYPVSIPCLDDMPRWYRAQAKRVLREAKLILPVSIDLGKQLKALAPHTAIEVVPNVVHTDYFHPLPAGDSSIKRFVHFSYLNEQKNPEGIVEALCLLRDRGYEFRFDFFGAKPYALIHLIRSYALESMVGVHDGIPYQEVAREMQRSDGLVLFSRFENQPCVLLEAQAVGIPVVATTVGGIPEVVGKEQGFLVPVDDVNALADAMEKLLLHPEQFDRAFIAAQAAQRYNYVAVRLKLMLCYQQVVGRS